MTQFTRRSFLAAVGLTAAAGTLSACAGPGGSTQPTATGTSAALDASKANGAISFAHWRAEDKAAFETIIGEFTKKYAGTSVRQDITPSNDYQSNALAQIRQGTVGDLFSAFRGAQFNDMAKAGLFTDLTSTGLADKYTANLIAPGASDGKQLGFPYQLVLNMPVYNQEMLTGVGATAPPADWDGFLALCEKLKGTGVVPMAWPGGEIGNAGHLFNSMVMNAAPSDDMCAQIEAGTMKVTDDWFLGMLKQYQQLIPYFQPNATGTAVEPAQQMFASGKAAMLVTGTFHMAAVRALGAKFGMNVLSPITTTADKAKYQGIHNATFIMGVSTASKNPNTAFALLSLLSDPTIAGKYGDATAQLVTLKNVNYSNADLNATKGWLDKKTLLAPRFQFNNLNVRNAVEGACIAVVGGKSPDQAASEAQTVVDQQIKK